jgi:hypothetical protein
MSDRNDIRSAYAGYTRTISVGMQSNSKSESSELLEFDRTDVSGLKMLGHEFDELAP